MRYINLLTYLLTCLLYGVRLIVWTQRNDKLVRHVEIICCQCHCLVPSSKITSFPSAAGRWSVDVVEGLNLTIQTVTSCRDWVSSRRLISALTGPHSDAKSTSSPCSSSRPHRPPSPSRRSRSVLISTANCATRCISINHESKHSYMQGLLGEGVFNSVAYRA